MAENLYRYFGHQPLDLSGAQNIYESSKLPLHGLSEARRRRKLWQDISRMKTSQSILKASGVPVSDWTAGLRSAATQTQPGMTKSQAEAEEQEKFLGETIRRYKPKNDTQLRNLVSAIGLGPEWFSKAKSMASVYNLGPEEMLYGRTEGGDITIATGQSGDPRMTALKETGEYFKDKAVFDEIEQQEVEKMRFAAGQAASQQTFALWDEAKAWLKERQADTATGQSDINWFDPQIINDFFSMQEKLLKKGDKYTLYFMKKREGKSPVLGTATVRKGSQKEAEIEAEYPGASLSKDAALTAGGVDTKQSDLISKGLRAEGSPADKLKVIFDGAENIYIADRLKFQKDATDAIYAPELKAINFKIKQIQRDEGLNKALTKEQLDTVMPAIRRALDSAGSVVMPTTGVGPRAKRRPLSDDVWINKIVDSTMKNIEGISGFTEAARKAVGDYIKDTLKGRREATKFGVDMEVAMAGLASERLTQEKRALEIQKITYENLTNANATKANAVIQAAFDLYENGEMPVDPATQQPESLRTYIEKQLNMQRIAIYDDEVWAKLRTEIQGFENDIQKDKKTVLEIARLRQQEDIGVETLKQAKLETKEKMFKVETDYGAITPGYRYDKDGKIYMDEDGKPVYVVTKDQQTAAGEAGADRAAPRAYQGIDSKYFIYNGGITKQVGTDAKNEPIYEEVHPNLVGQPLLSRVGSRDELRTLQRDLQSQHGKSITGIQNVQTRFEAVKAALESGEALGDHAAIINFMRTMDDSIVTEAEIATLKSHASFIDQMRQIKDSWITGRKLTPVQRGMIAYLMEQALSALHVTKFADIFDTVSNWESMYGPEKEPLNPIVAADIAPWLSRWMSDKKQTIDIPNKPDAPTEKKATEMTATELQDSVITIEDITDETGATIYVKPRDESVVDKFDRVDQTTTSRPIEMPVSKTGTFDLSNVPVLEWEDNLNLLLRTLRVSLGPEDDYIKDIQEAIRKIRAGKGRP